MVFQVDGKSLFEQVMAPQNRAGEIPRERTQSKFGRLTEFDIRAGTVTLEYQPVINVENRSVVFFECLARLILADGRVVPAGAFIDKIQTTSTGRYLDIEVLKKLAFDLVDVPKYRFSINVSINSLVNRDWCKVFDTFVSENPRLSHRMILEIDEESTLAVPDYVSDFMNEFQARGVLFALDNFGKGNVSLKNLVELPFDIIKIDNFFFKGLTDNADKLVLLQIVLNIAKELDAQIVAEKVETSTDVLSLHNYGIHLVQGEFVGNPTYISVLKKKYCRD